MSTRSLVSVMLLVFSASAAHGDCGSIPYLPNVKIFEPTQRALIAFNGRRQILLLSTDLRASKPTKVLEVMPCPSEPKVSKGNLKAFETATNLINSRLGSEAGAQGGAGGFGGAGGKHAGKAARPPAGEVTFHKRIGAHDISVVRVVRRSDFVQWVEDHLRGQGVDQPKIPEPLKEVIGEYLAEKFLWFAFNVVELGKSTVTKEAVQYEFKTRKLYYPLRITRAETGATTVRLLIISQRLVRLPDLRPATVRLLHEPFLISPKEIQSISKDMRSLLPHGGMIRIWEVNGELAAFKRDILTK